MYEGNKGKFEDAESYLEEIRAEKEELFKLKKQFQDQRREYNKLLTSDARAEHLDSKLVEAAKSLSDRYPLISSGKVFKPSLHKEAVLCWSDWHYGMITDNIWNTYNTSICLERVSKLTEMVKVFLRNQGIDVLTIVTLGDAAHGGIHCSARVKSEEDVCDQLMNVSEIMAQAINSLSEVVNEVRVYSCYGNHMRTIQNKNDSVHSDNMEKIIPWWLKQRLKDNYKVSIYESEFKEFTEIDVLGSRIIAVHGDTFNFKDLGITLNSLFTKKFNKTIDYTVSGDKHHLEEFEKFGIESVLVRSLCGTDDYANDHRLYSKAGQTLMIFNDVYGRECTYHIPLD